MHYYIGIILVLRYFILLSWLKDVLKCYRQMFRGHPFMTSTWRGKGVRLRWTEGRGPAPCGRPHRKVKLESTDLILSSSHAKKLASFLPEFCLWTKKVEIFRRYKLVI